MSFNDFYNFSIRAHVWLTAFATLQIEKYRVVKYDSKWSTNFHNDCMLEKNFIELFRRLMMIFIIFKIVLGAHVWHRPISTLQIELYRVMDYGSKWYTNYHKDCNLDCF